MHQAVETSTPGTTLVAAEVFGSAVALGPRPVPAPVASSPDASSGTIGCTGDAGTPNAADAQETPDLDVEEVAAEVAAALAGATPLLAPPTPRASRWGPRHRAVGAAAIGQLVTGERATPAPTQRPSRATTRWRQRHPTQLP
ncbi:hypothetical protein PHYPSEUDO_006066, partial [Phytophthora pseudosyringae]